MSYTPVSPFMRPISSAHLTLITGTDAAPAELVNKWKMLRDLSKGQAAFGISERDLTVLQALLSFHPGDEIGPAPTIIFPSNRTICDRLHGMPCSTMRRHLGRLVAAGIILRKDSPTGKRYLRKSPIGECAFGFDLSPINRRANEITQAADQARALENRIRLKRETISLMRRDLIAIATLGIAQAPCPGLWDRMQDAATLAARDLRRKLSEADLDLISARFAELIAEARTRFVQFETSEMSTSDAQNEQRLLSSDKESQESESGLEDSADPNVKRFPIAEETENAVGMPLTLVTATCQSLRDFYPKSIETWHDLFNAASDLRPAMGISQPAWEEALLRMGSKSAAITLVAMLERFADIRNPSAYLRSLARKAEEGKFTPAPMVLALTSGKRAA